MLNDKYKYTVYMVMAVIMILPTNKVSAAPADVPKTGQATSYDANAVKTDDGGLRKGVAWPSTRFVTNTDTTVSDNLTGLVWAPNANLMPMRDDGWDAAGTANDGMVTWRNALNYIVKLNAENYLGYSDWRLPNVNELESLIHEGFNEETCSGSPCSSNAAWLGTQGFSDVQADYYWSSSHQASDPVYAWDISMNDGEINLNNKTNDVEFVWPVRGRQ